MSRRFVVRKFMVLFLSNWFIYMKQRVALSNSVLRKYQHNASKTEPTLLENVTNTLDDKLTYSSVDQMKSKNNITIIPFYSDEEFNVFFYIYIQVGSPPQTQSVILDTGSSLLGFSCKTCQHCGNHMHPWFDPSVSETLDWLSCPSAQCFSNECIDMKGKSTCSYSQNYVEGSRISGGFFGDVVALGDSRHHSNFIRYNYIGCHQLETHLFYNQSVNGIMGLSRPFFSLQPFIFDNFLATEPNKPRIMAMCASQRGGALQLGGYESSWHTPQASTFFNSSAASFFTAETPQLESTMASLQNDSVLWTRNILKRGYSVEIVGLHIIAGTTSLPYNIKTSCSLDSGSTYTYFPSKFMTEYRNILNERCEEAKEQCTVTEIYSPHNLCLKINSSATSEVYPVFHLTFPEGGITILKPESYLSNEASDVFCAQIDSRRDNACVLGMSFFKKRNIIFDFQNEKIGFADAECPTMYPAQNVNSPEQYGVSSGVDSSHTGLNQWEDLSSKNSIQPFQFLHSVSNYAPASPLSIVLMLTLIIFIFSSIAYKIVRERRRKTYTLINFSNNEMMENVTENDVARSTIRPMDAPAMDLGP